MKNAYKSVIMITVLALGTMLHAGNLNTSLDDLDGNSTQLSDLAGEKLTILDFWATWCGPCVRSIPELIKISADYEGKGVSLVGINEDGPRNLSKVKPFVKARKISYPVVIDGDGDMMQSYDVSSLPTLIIVDKKGKELYRHEGFFPGDEEEIREELDELLK